MYICIALFVCGPELERVIVNYTEDIFLVKCV